MVTSEEKKITVAVVGFGLSARVFHLPFVSSSEQFELVAISSRQKNLIAEQHPGVQVFAKAETMITESSVDLIIVTAPNDAHFMLAELAVKNNKHVILEKPFVVNVEQGEALIRLAQARGKIIAPYHNRRWDGDFLTVKRLLAQGQFGEIKVFESRFDRFRPKLRKRWRELPGEGSGMLFDLGPHLIDQALDLFGKPTALTARCLPLRANSETVDYFHLLLHYPDKEVILNTSPFSAGPNIRFHIQGTEGAYVKYGLDPQEERLRAGLIPDSDNWAAETPDQFGKLYKDGKAQVIATETGGYQHLFNNVADTIKNRADLAVKPADAVATIGLIMRAEQSAAEERTVDLRNL